VVPEFDCAPVAPGTAATPALGATGLDPIGKLTSASTFEVPVAGSTITVPDTHPSADNAMGSGSAAFEKTRNVWVGMVVLKTLTTEDPARAADVSVFFIVELSVLHPAAIAAI